MFLIRCVCTWLIQATKKEEADKGFSLSSDRVRFNVWLNIGYSQVRALKKKTLFLLITYLSKFMGNRCLLRYEIKCHSTHPAWGSSVVNSSLVPWPKKVKEGHERDQASSTNFLLMYIWSIHDISLSPETHQLKRSMWYFRSIDHDNALTFWHITCLGGRMDISSVYLFKYWNKQFTPKWQCNLLTLHVIPRPVYFLGTKGECRTMY